MFRGFRVQGSGVRVKVRARVKGVRIKGKGLRVRVTVESKTTRQG